MLIVRIQICFFAYVITTIISCGSAYGSFLSPKQRGHLNEGIENRSDSIKKIQELNKIGRDLIYVDQATSFNNLQEAFSLASELNDARLIASAFRNLGSLLIVQKNYINGLEYISRAKNLFIEQKDSLGIANCDLSLGLIYEEIGNHQQAISYTKKAYLYYKSKDLTDRIGVSTNNIASHYIKANQFDSASHYINISKEINTKNENYDVLTANYYLLALIDFEKGFKTKSKNNASLAFKLAVKLDYQVNKKALTESAILLHLIYRENKQKDSSIFFINKAEELATQNGYGALLAEALWNYINMPEGWLAKNERDNRLLFYKKTVDSLQSVQYKSQLQSLDLLDRTYKAEKNVKRLSNRVQDDLDLIKKQRTQLFFGIISLIFLALLVLIIYNSRNKIKRINLQLFKAKKALEKSSKEVQRQNKKLSSQKTKLENSRLLMRSFIDALPLNIAMADRNGKIVIASKAYKDLFSFHTSTIEGAHFTEVLPPIVMKKHKSLLEKAYKGETLNFEESYTLPDGKERFYTGNYTPIFKGKKLIYLAFYNLDITKLKQTEIDLKKLNRTKDKLVSIIAHDFKAPFNTLLGISEILAKNNEAFTKEELQKVSGEIRLTIKRSLSFADNLLLWARSQMKSMRTEISIHYPKSIVEEVLEEIEPIAKAKNITIINHILASSKVLCDRNQLMIVFRNLLMNALKFSHAGKQVTIAERTLQDKLRISIKDEGVGMNIEKATSIFSSFNDSNEGTEGEKGTGLGLMICRDFIKEHGGEIWVESEIGQGSTFYFTLPLAETAN